MSLNAIPDPPVFWSFYITLDTKIRSKWRKKRAFLLSSIIMPLICLMTWLLCTETANRLKQNRGKKKKRNRT